MADIVVKYTGPSPKRILVGYADPETGSSVIERDTEITIEESWGDDLVAAGSFVEVEEV